MIKEVLLFLVGGPLIVECVGYLWHRFVEHKVIFGKILLYRHWVHHKVEYTTNNLRREEYHNANSWSWFVLAGLTIGLVFILFTIKEAIILSLSGLL